MQFHSVPSHRWRWILSIVCIAACWLGGCKQPLADDAIELRARELNESSGLAVSHNAPSILWTHNDSGDSARLFAFDLQGNCLAELELDGVKAEDWEDMCSFTHEGKSYLAVGDTGDNSRKRKKVAIHVFEEPRLNMEKPTTGEGQAPVQQIEIEDVLTIEVEYPQSVDCESLAYDPRRSEFLLCSKETFTSGLYRVPFTWDVADTKKKKDEQKVEVVAEQVAPVPLATAADISADGELLIICSYGPAFVFSRGDDGAWDVESGQPRMLPLPARRQGETICFSADAKRVMVTSEKSPTPLWDLPFGLELLEVAASSD